MSNRFVYCLTYFTICFSTASVLIPSLSETETSLIEYSKNPARQNDLYSKVALINTDSSCSYLVDQYAKNLLVPKILNKVENTLFTDYFLFLSDFKKLRNITASWQTQKNTHFIICNPTKNTIIHPLAEYLWSKKFINFVLVYHENELKVVTFNPFTNRILELSNRIFQNKIKNVAKYGIKVALYENPPILLKKDNQWKGKDFYYLQLVMFAMNANLNIVEISPKKEFEGVAKALRENQADFSFMAIFQGREFSNIDVFYPHVYDGIVVMLPLKKVSLHFLEVLDKSTWVLLSITMVLIWFLVWKIDLKYRYTFKLLLLLFISVPSIFCYLFQSKFGSVLTRNSEDGFKTLHELNDSKVACFTFKRFFQIMLTAGKLLKCVEVRPKGEIYKMIERNEERIFILTHGIALEFVKNHPYTIIKEFLVPGQKTYLFQKNSPYMDEINIIFLYLQAGGFISKSYVQEKTFQEEEQNFLKLKHLYSVFYFLGFGYLSSFLVFIFENKL